MALKESYANEPARSTGGLGFVRRDVESGGVRIARAVREAIGEYTEAHANLEAVSGDIAAVLAFDYEHRRAIEELHTTQHEFQDVIDTTSHTHQGEWCLEAVFCRGSAERVRELTYRLRDFDAVGRVKVLLLHR